MDAARGALLYVIAPLWILSGLADWWCHRRTEIEKTSGWPESVFHLVMFAQVGLGGLAVLLLEVNAALLAALTLLFLIHEFTTWIELRFVAPVRHITPAEQMIHSFMELLPLAAILLLAVWSAGQGRAHADMDTAWQLRWKSPVVLEPSIAALGVAIFVLNFLPLVEEAVRCLKTRRRPRGH